MLLAVVITRPCAAGKTQDELDAWAGERIECSVRADGDCELPCRLRWLLRRRPTRGRLLNFKDSVTESSREVFNSESVSIKSSTGFESVRIQCCSQY